MAADEPVNKKLIFDDLASPVKRDSFIASPKQPIRLYCRVRPQLPEEVSRKESPCLHVADAQTLVSVAPEESFAYKSTQRGLAHRSHQFNFTKVFGPPSTQQDVFNDAVTHILKVCACVCVPFHTLQHTPVCVCVMCDVSVSSGIRRSRVVHYHFIHLCGWV